MNAEVVSIGIDRPWQEVYDAIWRPEDFAKWASGLSAAALTQDGDAWRGNGPEGPITVRFSPHNRFGILDHWVDTGGPTEIYIPLRVIANGSCSEVQLTLFQQPGQSADRFAADKAWVARDLKALAALFGS
jgi:hypothetical protein